MCNALPLHTVARTGRLPARSARGDARPLQTVVRVLTTSIFQGGDRSRPWLLLLITNIDWLLLLIIIIDYSYY